MPYLLKLLSIKTVKLIKQCIIDCGFEFPEEYSFVGIPKSAPGASKIRTRNLDSNHYVKELGRARFGCDKNRTSSDGFLLEHGQVAYFKIRGRLMRGFAFYDLNDRWCISYDKYDVAYISSCEITVNPEVKKGRVFSERDINGRLQSELSKAVNGADYLRAHQLKQIIMKDQMFRIWSTKHGGGWWRVNGCGYTENINNAGLFKKEEVDRLCKNDNELSMKVA